MTYSLVTVFLNAVIRHKKVTCVVISRDDGIGATLYVTMVTCQSGIYTLGKRIVFFLLTGAFCGRKYAENAIAAGGSVPDPTGGTHDAPTYPVVGWGADTHPSP